MASLSLSGGFSEVGQFGNVRKGYGLWQLPHVCFNFMTLDLKEEFSQAL